MEKLLSHSVYLCLYKEWSVGCILGELLLRRPLFPDRDDHHQLLLIFSLIGSPSNDHIANLPSTLQPPLLSLPFCPPSSFSTKFPNSNPLALDLLTELLLFDPFSRITVEEALSHPYFSQLHLLEDEPSTKPVPLSDFTFLKSHTSLRDLQEEMYEEVLRYHFPGREMMFEGREQGEIDEGEWRDVLE